MAPDGMLDPVADIDVGYTDRVSDAPDLLIASHSHGLYSSLLLSCKTRVSHLVPSCAHDRRPHPSDRGCKGNAAHPSMSIPVFSAQLWRFDLIIYTLIIPFGKRSPLWLLRQ